MKITIKKGIYKGDTGELLEKNGDYHIAFPDKKERKYSGIISKEELLLEAEKYTLKKELTDETEPMKDKKKTIEEEEKVCEKCGEETGVRYIGDEGYDYCNSCDWITH